jgi:hypothetical protein
MFNNLFREKNGSICGTLIKNTPIYGVFLGKLKFCPIFGGYNLKFLEQ